MSNPSPADKNLLGLLQITDVTEQAARWLQNNRYRLQIGHDIQREVYSAEQALETALATIKQLRAADVAAGTLPLRAAATFGVQESGWPMDAIEADAIEPRPAPPPRSVHSGEGLRCRSRRNMLWVRLSTTLHGEERDNK